ncbi:hypothetical protein [Crassaminicella profunda]|uniref:hypothetical protein n=1 Tax=Crassaminicella profunda TaxID=1286698 RepID=UPI001CA74E3B|nr:hypothetical protein [Crassaminicella profunda]QZY55672.1 hypothetical protein K7H06_01255 [Crassaminicella profunda]
MNNMIGFLGKVVLFGVTIAFLLAWGYVKQQRKTEELLKILYRKCEERIIKELKKTEELTGKEIEKIIHGTKASLFWSKNKLQVTDSKIVMKHLLMELLNKGTIEIVANSKPKKYKLKC